MADEHLISLQPGTVIGGKYEVVKCLGAGSMGLVYACRHRELASHMVAMKVLFPEVAQDKIAAARFRNEIFASYGVSHPNVVRAYEYLRDGDLVAYTMEYVGGGDLAERLGRPQDPVPISDCIRFLSEMASGVQAIHDAGIVHRDLKPENILLTKDGHVKIADFGIAKAGHGPKLTEHGGVVGTIDYVSPEYMLNSQVDWRSDIYAIGILGYEMVTGESPFRGDSVYATMTKRLKSDPVAPSAIRSDCPKDLDTIVLKAMHRDPELRYQSAAEMFYDLQPLLSDTAKQSGSFLQLTRAASASYVGPTLQKGGSEPESRSEPRRDEPTRARSQAMSGRVDNDFGHDTGFGVSDHDQVSRSYDEFTRDTDSGAPFSNRQQIEVAETMVLNSDIESIAATYDEDRTIHEPVKMERMLNYSEPLSGGGWDRPQSQGVQPQSVAVNQTDDQRFKRLSQMADKVNHSIWVDILTLVFAVVLGVGLGFMVLRVVFPEFVGSRVSSTPVGADSL